MGEIKYYFKEEPEWDGDVKYFKLKEFACKCGKCDGLANVNFDLVLALDKLREKYGLPIKINSGYRCLQHPNTKDSPTSSHYVGGCAADISVKSSRERFMLLDLIIRHDLFDRIGIGKDFLHLDIDKDKDKMVAWLY